MRRPEDLRAFAGRDWTGIARAKRAAWQDDRRKDGAISALTKSSELLRYVQALRPAWPSEADLRADCAVHLRVFNALGRVPAKRS